MLEQHPVTAAMRSDVHGAASLALDPKHHRPLYLTDALTFMEGQAKVLLITLMQYILKVPISSDSPSVRQHAYYLEPLTKTATYTNVLLCVSVL